MSVVGEIYDRLGNWLDGEVDKGSKITELAFVLLRHTAVVCRMLNVPREQFLNMAAAEYDLITPPKEQKN